MGTTRRAGRGAGVVAAARPSAVVQLTGCARAAQGGRGGGTTQTAGEGDGAAVVDGDQLVRLKERRNSKNERERERERDWISLIFSLFFCVGIL